MVGDDAHGDVGVMALAILVAGKLPDAGEHAAEHVGVVIGILALEHGAEALEAHAGIDVLGRQRFEMAVGQALELHEHEVPYLDHVGVAHVDEVAPRHPGCTLLRRADVDVYLAGRAARTGVAHLPEIVMLVAKDDVVLRQMLEPGLLRLLVHGGTVLGGTLENGGIKLLGVDAVNICKQLPGHVYGAFLEIVAETPVAEHLEHRMMVSVVPDLFKVVVLAAHAEAFLRIRSAVVPGLGIAQEYILELVHAGIGEHEGRIVLHYHRSRRDYGVSLGGEIVQEFLSDFFGSHNTLY